VDQSKVRDWQQAVDTAELSPLTQNLPKEFTAGDIHHELGTDDIHRKWLAVEIVAGNSGSRWAYWAAWIDPKTGRYGVGPNPRHQAIADGIFNGDAAHFIGMLGIPYAKIPIVASTVWVLVSPRMTGPPPQRIVDETPKTRYEKSKEVFDVNTQESRKLP
jgi:hypothetical protein